MDIEQSTLLYAAIGIFALAVLVTALYLAAQYRRQQQQPKYGFLGKRIAGLITTAIIGAGLFGGVYLSTQEQTSFETEASLEIGIDYAREKISDNQTSASYTYRVIPTLDGVAYGAREINRFDVYWNFIATNGSEREAVSEVDVSQSNPSAVTLTLPKGTYEMIILVNYVDPETNQTFSETLKDTVVF
ncbi:MAG: hypothetical protein ACOCXP_01135 [Candidatus Dojkabacteria bacterium]